MLSLTATIFGYYDACFDFRLEDKIENDDDSDTIYVDTNVVVDMNLAQALYTKLFFLLGILWSIDAVQVPLSMITFDKGTFFFFNLFSRIGVYPAPSVLRFFWHFKQILRFGYADAAGLNLFKLFKL